MVSRDASILQSPMMISPLTSPVRRNYLSFKTSLTLCSVLGAGKEEQQERGIRKGKLLAGGGRRSNTWPTWSGRI